MASEKNKRGDFNTGNLGIILTQTGYYLVVLLLAVLIVSFIQRGFFWKFLKVRLSFGKLILVKLRNPLRDHFAVGHVEDSFLMYKIHKNWRRHAIPAKEPIFYRSLGMTWLDVDEVTGAFCKPDYSGVTGFDSQKFQDLYVRALYKPAITNNQDKIIIGCVILLIVLVIVLAFFMYKHQVMLQTIQASLEGLKTATIVPASGV